MSYKIIKIPEILEQPYSEMSAKGAKTFFRWFNEIVPTRLSELNSLLKDSGENITLNYSPTSLLPLGYWLKRVLGIRRKTAGEVILVSEHIPYWLQDSLKPQETELTEKSLSIAFDSAIYFSEVW